MLGMPPCPARSPLLTLENRIPYAPPNSVETDFGYNEATTAVSAGAGTKAIGLGALDRR
jgi:hypothetical protein